MIKVEIEGQDGSGKTTALKYFVKKAKELGLNVVETREVGNPHIPACLKLREFVLDPASNLRGETMELLFAAMRFENDLWLQKLAESDNPPDLVVSDRGWCSHLAYTDHNVSKEFTIDFYENFVANYTTMPDVIIYFSVDTDIAQPRRVKRGTGTDVIEMKGVEFQEKVKNSFEKWIEAYKGVSSIEFFEVDANQDIEGVQKQIDGILDFLTSEV